MSDVNRKPPQLTLIGMAPQGDWKLQPYRDVHVPTPSHSRPLRERGESTPVYIPPARRVVKREPTVKLNTTPPDPGFSVQFLAASLVAVAVLAALLCIP